VWDPTPDRHAYNYTAPHGTLLRDGTLLVVGFRTDASDPLALMFNPETGGVCETEAILFRSSDYGRTWSAPQVLDLPGDGTVNAPAPIIELNNGRLFLACEKWKPWDDTRPLHIKGFGLFSDDGGRTWGDRAEFPSASDCEKMYSHTRYSKMLDGRVIGLQWTQSVADPDHDHDLHLVTADETATKWSPAQPTGIMAQTSWVAHLGEGVLAAAYTQRKGMQPGIVVSLSEDLGRSWNYDHDVLVWDAVGQEYLGAQHKPAYPASHENIAFGKPNLTRLPDGVLICSWWCTQACVTHIRYTRLNVMGEA
jgi:hypothetical protein